LDALATQALSSHFPARQHPRLGTSVIATRRAQKLMQVVTDSRDQNRAFHRSTASPRINNNHTHLLVSRSCVPRPLQQVLAIEDDPVLGQNMKTSQGQARDPS